MRTPSLILLLSTLASPLGCSEEAPAEGSATATAKPTTTPAKTTPAASSAPTAVPDRSDCPKDSSGPGTLEKPCEGKGKVRLMEAKWNNKIDDKGPFFNITNKSPSAVLYTKVVVYFYDKAGKQLEVKDGTSGKSTPNRICSSNIPGGVMKVNEKALIQFGCVKKSDVPEGTAAIEAELMTVGFADASEKKTEFFWQNKDLAPDTRPKGGVK